MDSKIDGGPAFPVNTANAGEGGACYPSEGMSLRDYFAAKALAPCMYICANDTLEEGETRAQLFARKAYEMADAMLKARSA